MKVLYMDSRISDYTPGGQPIYDRPTSAADQRDINRAILSNGVYPNPSDNLQVMQGEGMAVLVKPGLCMVEGAPGIEVLTRTLLVQASHATFDRIDRVVARLNLAAENRSLDLFILQGTPAATPLAPALTRNNTVYEICLAELLIGHESTSVPQYKITDTRGDANLCGWIHGVVSQVDTSTIFNQYAAWFEFIQQQWDNWWSTQQDTTGYLTCAGEYSELNTKSKKIFRAINEVNEKGSIGILVTLPTTGWTLTSGKYYKTVEIEDILVDCNQMVGAYPDDMVKADEYEACGITALTPQVDGSLTFVAESVPKMEVVATVIQTSGAVRG